MMDVVHARCAGLDVHKDTVVAGVRLADKGPARTEVRTFGTTTPELLALSAWLAEHDCTHIAMEATGVYWRPVWHILSDGEFTLILANASHVKSVPGRKTDVADVLWLADLLAHGLIRPSFVPDAATHPSAEGRAPDGGWLVGMEQPIRLERLDDIGKRQVPVNAEPRSGVAVPLNVEPILADPVEAGEGCVELLIEVFGETRAVALDETIFGAMPLAEDVDRVVERRRPDSWQEPWLEERLDQPLAGFGDTGLLHLGKYGP
jgi:hypothetical protein